jgi:hypothetical protein
MNEDGGVEICKFEAFKNATFERGLTKDGTSYPQTLRLRLASLLGKPNVIGQKFKVLQLAWLIWGYLCDWLRSFRELGVVSEGSD